MAPRSAPRSANLLKIIEGGWIPLVLGAVIMGIMYTWRRGSRLLVQKTRRRKCRSAGSLQVWNVRCRNGAGHSGVPHGRSGICADRTVAQPQALQGAARENVILTIEIANTPRIDPSERVRIEPVGETFSRVSLRFGFMETPNVPRALAIARKLGASSTSCRRRSSCRADRSDRRRISDMPKWQDRLFIMLTRVAKDATSYFQSPTGRVVEVGTQVTIDPGRSSPVLPRSSKGGRSLGAIWVCCGRSTSTSGTGPERRPILIVTTSAIGGSADAEQRAAKGRWSPGADITQPHEKLKLGALSALDAQAPV